MEVKVDHRSDIEGSNTFLSSIVIFMYFVIIGRFILL